MYDHFNAGSGKGWDSKEYEITLRQGINAAKDNRRKLARRLLLSAAAQQGNDPRPWIWLATTTDEIQEKREYLEKAVGLDPTNEAARRALAELRASQGEIPELRPVGAEPPVPDQEAAPVRSLGLSFTCPHCGATTRYDPGVQDVVCDHCGQLVPTPEDLARGVDQSVHEALLQDKAFTWAALQQEVVCSQCGAHTLLPPEQKSTQCPFCGSNQLVVAEKNTALEDPKRIGLFEVQEKKARLLALKWLEHGWLTPDNIKREVRKMSLRPAYYPFWLISGLLQIPWSVEVEAPMRRDSWELRTGSLQEVFNNVLIPGTKAFTWRETQRLEPFYLDRLVKFDPGHLAGWSALTYDRPLAEAYLDARERVITALRQRAPGRIEPGKGKRNLRLGAGAWADVSYQLILLPIWVGSYQFGKKTFYLMVNGQTGEVHGDKPRDLLKLVLPVLIVSIVLLIAWLVLRFGFGLGG